MTQGASCEKLMLLLLIVSGHLYLTLGVLSDSGSLLLVACMRLHGRVSKGEVGISCLYIE